MDGQGADRVRREFRDRTDLHFFAMPDLLYLGAKWGYLSTTSHLIPLVLYYNRDYDWEVRWYDHCRIGKDCDGNGDYGWPVE